MKIQIKNPKKGTRVSFEHFDQYCMLHITHLDARYAWETEQSSYSYGEERKEIFTVYPTADHKNYKNASLLPDTGDEMEIIIKDMSKRYVMHPFYSRSKESEYFVFLTKDAYAAIPLKAEEFEV